MSAQIHTYADANYSLELIIDWAGGRIAIGERHESENGITFYRYHGHESAYSLPDAITISDWESLNEILQPLIDRAAAGYDARWDGGNHIAHFNGDATAAIAEINNLIENYRWDEVEA